MATHEAPPPDGTGVVEHHSPEPHHGPSMQTYMTVFVLLLVMTAVTVGVAFLDMGALNTPIAIGIAVFKATIVVLFFMHVYYGSRLTWMGIATAIFFLAVMIVFTASDFATRAPLSIPIR